MWLARPGVLDSELWQLGLAQNNQKISGTKAEVSIESECGLCESMSCLKSTLKIFESFRTVSSISLNDLGSS